MMRYCLIELGLEQEGPQTSSAKDCGSGNRFGWRTACVACEKEFNLKDL